MTEQRFDPKSLPVWRRWLLAVQTEFVGVHPRLHAYNVVSRMLPAHAAGDVRAALFRRAGFSVGSGTRIEGSLNVTGPRGLRERLVVGKDCVIADGCVFELTGELTLGDRVTLEPGVMLLTSTHELDAAYHRAGKLVTNPVSIGNGALLRARVVVLPGVKIGEGAIVEAGAVVNKDVPPNTRAGGIPAVNLGPLANGNAG